MNINNESYCVGIMTYSKRRSFLETIIQDVRRQSDIVIYLAVNCDYNEQFNHDYRNYILNLCLKYNNIYPSFYLKFRGCPKVWNDIVINSSYDNCLILNDDIRLHNNFIQDIIEFKNVNNIKTIIKTDASWSAFLVNKKYLEQSGFFNEEYLGIGFEDAEFEHRVGPQTAYYTPNYEGLSYMTNNTFPGSEHLTDGSKKYSSFNQNLFESGKIAHGINFRPYEAFYTENYNKIFQ